MKLNCLNIMKSGYDVEDMRLNSKSKDGDPCGGMQLGKRLRSRHTRRAFNHRLKRKWRREMQRQAKESIEDFKNDHHLIVNEGDIK